MHTARRGNFNFAAEPIVALVSLVLALGFSLGIGVVLTGGHAGRERGEGLAC